MTVELGTFIGIWVIVGFIYGPRIPVWIRRVRGKYHVWRYFREHSSGYLKGYGLMLNGSPILENNGPLLFDDIKLAQAYAKGRELGKKHDLNKKAKPPEVNFQEWDLENFRLTCMEVRIV